RPGGENVTASDASESPYTGIRARSSKPNRAKRSQKRRTAAGAIGSAPFNTRRNEERSIPSSSSSRTRLAQSPKAKLGATVIVARDRAIARRHKAGRARNSSG